MRTITKTFDIYEFDELSYNVKNKVINEYIAAEIEWADEDSIIWNSILEAEKMQTPWFTSEYVYDMHKDYIIKGCRCFEYYKNGDVACIKNEENF